MQSFIRCGAAVLAALFVCAACTRATDPVEATMHAGLDALYARHDPVAAAAAFRLVLERNPTHYGATYQLAAALDQVGKGDESAPLWERVLTMAEGYHDADTARTARAALARSTSVSEETLMKHGLEALTTQHDPAAAVELFRAVLARTPTHYGATFQLARALDATDQSAEAQPLWEKVLVMADSYHDAAAASTARARLQR